MNIGLALEAATLVSQRRAGEITFDIAPHDSPEYHIVDMAEDGLEQLYQLIAAPPAIDHVAVAAPQFAACDLHPVPVYIVYLQLPMIEMLRPPAGEGYLPVIRQRRYRFPELFIKIICQAHIILKYHRRAVVISPDLLDHPHMAQVAAQVPCAVVAVLMAYTIIPGIKSIYKIHADPCLCKFPFAMCAALLGSLYIQAKKFHLCRFIIEEIS
jgi:hypothetical protein